MKTCNEASRPLWFPQKRSWKVTEKFDKALKSVFKVFMISPYSAHQGF